MCKFNEFSIWIHDWCHKAFSAIFNQRLQQQCSVCQAHSEFCGWVQLENAPWAWSVFQKRWMFDASHIQASVNTRILHTIVKNIIVMLLKLLLFILPRLLLQSENISKIPSRAISTLYIFCFQKYMISPHLCFCRGVIWCGKLSICQQKYPSQNCQFNCYDVLFIYVEACHYTMKSDNSKP